MSFPEVSDTQGDITVSVAQCLLDENNIRLAFYVDENGKSISSLNGREITVFMQNFGEHAGTWTLKWILGGADKTVEVKLEESLGNSGAIVTAVKVSPMFIHVYYDFAKRETMEAGVDENGNGIKSTDFAEPPRFVGLKMKDGTVYTGILDGGTYGYENGNTSTYIAKVGIVQVIDPKKVQSLLFLKDDSAVTGEHEITEEECYIVDIN
ncbi:MAG: hypothetical protein HDR01_06080 [Lachnospiraceae bacterium]|nr:hypothetical protein [Lachnospiraceae bacterium]